MDSKEEMKAKVPESVVSVCTTLRTAGYEAWIVGGAVRDLVLGKTPSDWDVASDALPNEVLAIFKKTIATGIAHGTVTAVVGRGRLRENVEITSFRGEGAYTDSRRPDSVHFGVPLDEDLLRRDFVINAMAFDPLVGEIYDPLGGIEDLRLGLVRAVGVASERFNEDGLRVMRAVRFVSTLDFELEADTEAGIGTALKPLAKVAQERVRVELLKLLDGIAPKRSLTIAGRSGVMDIILPELKQHSYSGTFHRVSLTDGDAIVRLGSLLASVECRAIEPLLRRLTVSNEERQRIVGMLRHQNEFSDALDSDVELRKHLSAVGRSAASDHLKILDAQGRCSDDDRLLVGVGKARDVLQSGVALEIGDLAIKGGRLIECTGLKGRAVGETLAALLAHVLEYPSSNESGLLERLAIDIASAT